MAKPRTAQPKRGDIVLLNFDPTIGTEIKKIRPALVILNDIGVCPSNEAHDHERVLSCCKTPDFEVESTIRMPSK